LADDKYVKCVKRNFIFQRRVPTDLVEIIGRVQWYQSLKTQDRRTAVQRAKILVNETDNAIANGYRLLQGKPLSGDEISTFGDTHFERTNAYLDTFSTGIAGSDSAIMRRDLERRSKPTLDDIAAGLLDDLDTSEPDPEFLRRAAQLRLATLIERLQAGKYDLVHTFADAAYERQGLARRVREPEDPANPTGAQIEWLEIDRDRADYQALARELMLREVQAVKRALVHLQKAEIGWIDPPQQILVPAQAAGSAPSELAPDASKTPTQLLERFTRDSRDARGASTMRSFTTCLERLEQVTGQRPIAMITRNDVVEWYDLFSQCPEKYKTRLKVATMKEAIVNNADGVVPVVQPATVQKDISHLNCFFEWAKKRNLIAANPVGDLSIERSKKPATASEEGKTYSADELNAIFKLKPFTVPPAERGYRFWVPLVALFTGSRMGEVCQLDAVDVRNEGELWWFDFHQRSPDQSIKTGKPREVPVHSNLMKAGFLDYVKRQRTKGERKLFPDAPRGAEGRNPYQPVSQWFAKLLSDAKLKRPGVNLHAFRHTFITACRNSGIPKEMAEALVGHKNGSVHDGYGDPAGIERREEAMAKLTFKGLDLNHLTSKNSS
jgi:integrase